MHVHVIGAGPAGSSAALAALGAGASVTLYEQSQFPRHKVCGEFLSPETASLLAGLGVWPACEQLRPALLRRVFLALGERTKSWSLPQPAFGLSRFAMDAVLLNHAISQGAGFERGRMEPQPSAVLAVGRSAKAHAGNRLFGFKAHFTGSVDDVMSLFFFDGAYVGVNAVEGGKTNVCGVAPEALLKAHRFQIDEVLRRNRPLTERIAPLTRAMDWMLTAPLVFGVAPRTEAGNQAGYSAGDAAAFIDPFTGSGILGAVATGILAGRAASARQNLAVYRRSAQRLVTGQQRMASVVRRAIDSGWAERLMPLMPGSLLFHATRPNMPK